MDPGPEHAADKRKKPDSFALPILDPQGSMGQNGRIVKPAHQKLWDAARPYLDTRENDIHTRISVAFAYRLLEREGGDEDVVIPAVILHDVGWKRIPEHLHRKAFGPGAVSPEINRIHEVEGVVIARVLLEKARYDPIKTEEILQIIEGHDSRAEAFSVNDKIVKDADKLWRNTREGLRIDTARFGESYGGGLKRIQSHLDDWYFTLSAREMAASEIRDRIQEGTPEDPQTEG